MKHALSFSRLIVLLVLAYLSFNSAKAKSSMVAEAEASTAPTAAAANTKLSITAGSDNEELHPADVLRSQVTAEVKAKILQGDDFFRRREKPENAHESLRIFRELGKAHPKNAEIGFRLARSLYFVGIRLTEDREEKIKIFSEGIQVGDQSIVNDPKCSPCYFWLAINNALYGDTVGIFTMASKIKTIRRYLLKSVEIDPTYAWGGAHRLLGLIDQKLPWVLGGSKSDARKHFNKAIKSAPDEPLNYLFLARLERDEFEDKQTALKIAKQGLEVPPPQFHRLEAKDALLKLRDFVKELE